MAEKIRGALFNILGDIEGLTVLDAFAGGGSLSLEAISRGAKSAVAIDRDKYADRALRENITELGVEREVKAINANASGWSDNNPEAKFDIVILAPPYDDLQGKLLNKLKVHVEDKGLLVLDWPGHEQPAEFSGFEEISSKNYGDAQLVFYRRIK
jgi:16S rRNA (guanine966-N2)-methyltransferase